MTAQFPENMPQPETFEVISNSEHSASAPPVYSPAQLAQLKAQQAVEKQLLLTWIQHIRQTGEYDQLTELVEFVETEWAIANNPNLLPLQTIRVLCANLDTAIWDIAVSVDALRHCLDTLAMCLETTSTDPHSQVEQCGSEIKQHIEVLGRAIERLLNMGQKYGELHSQRRFLPTAWWLPGLSSGSDRTAEEQQERLRYLCDSLRYIRDYLLEQAQADLIRQEFAIAGDWAAYSRRLYHYLSRLPGYSAYLAQHLKHEIEAKAPLAAQRQPELDQPEATDASA